MKTMLLIDADNVSVGVMEQAVNALLNEHGALHVRRAYCTAESAAKHQTLFKRLGIRPVVNLATGKNSTDIAMAIDALDLALAERPDIVAIASSDSDFAPLVLRLREKGCRVVGFGQDGKTGDETKTVYDAFTVFPHRATTTASSAAAAPAPAKRARSAPPAPSAPRKTSADRAAANKAPGSASPTARKTAKRAAPKAPDATPPAPVARVSPSTAPLAPKGPTPAAAATGDMPPADKLRQILMALPELVRGDTVELRLAAERLRAAGLLSPGGASTRVFKAYPERFDLVPASNPNRVRLRD